MQRREFLAASTAAALGVAANHTVSAAQNAPRASGASAARQLIELRTYHFASPEKQRAFEQFLGSTAIAAFNRAGVEPAGAFKLRAEDNADLKPAPDFNDLYVLLPHKSAQAYLEFSTRLGADEAFYKAGRSVLAAPKSDPAFTRYESSLFLAFAGMPKLEVPSKAAGRVVQLRIYESHNNERAKKKIHMFDEGGEIAIFRRVGIHPVFFGQALAGPRMPNLTYMVAFDDERAMKAGWDAFLGDPEWKKLSADEAYRDTVSNIVNLVLRPVEGSQV